MTSRKEMRADRPARVVMAFYDAISRKEFRTAWSLLSPSVHASVVEIPGNAHKLHVALDAIDLINGKSVHSHYEGWWALTEAPDGQWLLDDGRFAKTQTDAPPPRMAERQSNIRRAVLERRNGSRCGSEDESPH